jgi:hypothetical protein
MMRQKGLVSYVHFCDNQAAVPACLYSTAFCANYVSSYFVNYGLGALCIVPIVMQCVTRGNILDAYQIRAQCNCCKDFCCACCCMSCSLVQEQRQLMQHQSEERRCSHITRACCILSTEIPCMYCSIGEFQCGWTMALCTFVLFEGSLSTMCIWAVLSLMWLASVMSRCMSTRFTYWCDKGMYEGDELFL